MHIILANVPIKIWPFPPKFQNFILKAGTKANATINNKDISLSNIQILLGVPKLPKNNWVITSKGLACAIHKRSMQHKISADKIAPPFINKDFCQDIFTLLLIWNKGSLFFIYKASLLTKLVINKPTSSLVVVLASTIPFTFPWHKTKILSLNASNTSKSSPT